jgi:hypothetical protein
MRSLFLSDGREMCTNDNAGGIFARKPDGTFAQWTGTSQTPRFTSAAQFWRYLKRHYPDVFTGVRRIRDTF